MILEEIVEILSRQRGRHYVLRRDVVSASSIAKSYKTCVMEFWEVGKEENKMLWKTETTGRYTDLYREALVRKAEESFMEKLFEWLEKRDEVFYAKDLGF